MIEVKIIDERENKLIGRKEIKFQLDYDKPPTRKEIKDKLMEVLGVQNHRLLVVRRMRNVFGLPRSIGLAHLYENEERLRKFEPAHIIKRWIEGYEQAKEAK